MINLSDGFMRVPCTLVYSLKISQQVKKNHRLLLDFFRGPKKSTLNVNRKIIPETPQLPPCCSSNISSIFPPLSLLLPLLGMLFRYPYGLLLTFRFLLKGYLDHPL